MRKLLLATAISLLCSFGAEAQRVRTLQAIIHTPSVSTAEVKCRVRGANLVLRVKPTEHHCIFDMRIEQKKRAAKKQTRSKK